MSSCDSKFYKKGIQLSAFQYHGHELRKDSILILLYWKEF